MELLLKVSKSFMLHPHFWSLMYHRTKRLPFSGMIWINYYRNIARIVSTFSRGH